MYNIGIQEYLIKDDKIELIAGYIDEHIGVDYEVDEGSSIIMFDITEAEHIALRAHISKHNAWLR